MFWEYKSNLLSGPQREIFSGGTKLDTGPPNLRAEIDNQVFSARTFAEALKHLFSVCKWPSKNICATIAETLQMGFLATCKWFPARF